MPQQVNVFTSHIFIAEILGNRWSANFTQHSLVALLTWMLLLIGLQAISWPLVRRMFSRLPDRGWSFARPITILLGGLIVWYPTSFGLIRSTSLTSMAAMLFLAAVAWLGVRRLPIATGERCWLSNPTAIIGEIVFWVVFLYFVLLRSLNPDSWHPYWGGEKPMEFAHLNAILRSETLPPSDPWYAGGHLNYYYFGTYLVANLIRITGIPAEIAFNLATPLFPAMLAAGAFSLGAIFGKRLTSSELGAALSGLASVFFVQFAGNLVVASRLWDRGVNDAPTGNAFVHWVWAPTRAIPDPSKQYAITEFPYFSALYADLHPHVMAMPYTLLVLALSWQIAANWRTIPLIFVRKRIGAIYQMELLVPFILLGITIGTIWMTNAWDMPMAVAFGVLGLTMMTIRVPTLRERIAIIVGGTIVLGVIAILVAYPFNRYFETLFGTVDIAVGYSPLIALESHVGAQLLICTLGAIILIGYVRQQLVQNPWIFRVSGVAVFLGLLVQWITRGSNDWMSLDSNALIALGIVAIWGTIAWQSAEEPNDFDIPKGWLQAAAMVAVVVSIWLLLFRLDTLALYLGIGLSAIVIWLGIERQSVRFIVALVAAATLLGAGLEIFYLVDDLNGSPWYRMNTIFKFYNQVWNQLGIASGVIVGVVIWRLLVWEEQKRMMRGRPIASRIGITSVRATAAVALPLMALMSAYMLVATPIRLDQQFANGGPLTLNAYSWMQYGTIPMTNAPPLAFADDLEAINWFNDNVSGSPVIAEAVFGTYRCFGSRYSVHTGLPAVVGWVRHERQQRLVDDLDLREQEMRSFYTTTDLAEKQAFLDRYNVEYVVVGQMERQYPRIVNGNDCESEGNPAAIAMIESMVGTDLEIAFQNDTTTVYRVTRHNP